MVRFSAVEQRVFDAALLQADAPVAVLAHRLEMRAHVVRRALDSISAKGVFIGTRPYINPFSLGYSEYFMYLSLDEGSKQTRSSFLAALCAHDHVSYVAEVGGDYQYEIRFLAKTTAALMDFLDLLASRFKSRVSTPAIAIGHEEEYSGNRMSRESDVKLSPPLSYAPVDEVYEVDALGDRLIRRIANGNFDSLSRIASDLRVPATTLSYRMEQLKRSGVITGHYYVCDVKPLSLMPVVFLLEGHIFTAQQRQALKRFCRTHPDIALLNLTLGPWQARIMARVKRQQDILDLTEDLYALVSDPVPVIRVLPQLRFHKVTPYPFQ